MAKKINYDFYDVNGRISNRLNRILHSTVLRREKIDSMTKLFKIAKVAHDTKNALTGYERMMAIVEAYEILNKPLEKDQAKIQ